jgi:TatD DNase family protein
MLVDSHCHLTLLDLDRHGGRLETVLTAAKAQGVGYFLCVSVDLDTFPAILKLAQAHQEVFASVGVHPNTPVDGELSIELLTELAALPKVVAIGETGLDYFRSHGDLEWQRRRFRLHIAAARKAQRPLIIHSREASEDVLRILAEEGAEEIGGVMHCFVEDWTTAQRAMDLNFYISFSGIVTFRNAKTVQETAKRIPLDRLLVETDSPYLAPVPYRGKDNQPAYVRYVAEYIAGLKGISLNELAEATTENFLRLFKQAAAGQV